MIKARLTSSLPLAPLRAAVLCAGIVLAAPGIARAQSEAIAPIAARDPVQDPAWTAVVAHGGKVPLETASLGGKKNHARDGIASYYWQGQMTASGETFNKRAMTAAHKTLPFGTMVRVTNLNNGRSAVVRINDRGPFKPGRVIDVSEAAAEALDLKGRGLAPVRVDPL